MHRPQSSNHDDGVLNLAAQVVSGQRKAADIPAHQSAAILGALVAAQAKVAAQIEGQALRSPHGSHREPQKAHRPADTKREIELVMDDPYLSLAQLVRYAGLSNRTLRRHLSGPPSTALPCHRIGGRVLVKRSAFDRWTEQHRSAGNPALARLLSEMGLDAPSTKA